MAGRLEAAIDETSLANSTCLGDKQTLGQQVKYLGMAAAARDLKWL
jgi:hypothetical protein